jgi:HlyD family secretion protein
MISILKHPLVIGSVVLAILMVIGSVAYYMIGTRPPTVVTVPGTTATTSITGYGVVESAANGDLSFGSAGRVASVPAVVGAHVTSGQMLASLDTGALEAARDQALANVHAQEARLAQLVAGPRPVDLAQKQTAVDQAAQTLRNDYDTVSTSVSNAYGKTYQAVHTDTDALFDHPDSQNPELFFTSRNTEAGGNTNFGRLRTNQELATWKQELLGLQDAPSAVLDKAIVASVQHLTVAIDFSNALLEALAGAEQTNDFDAADVVIANANASTLRDTLNTLLTGLQTLSQKIRTDALAVQSAENALSQATAGATTEDISAQQASVQGAQAALESANVALRNARIVAPFAGTVSSVQVKAGDWVSYDTRAVSLVPEQALQVTAQFSESDAAQVAPGDRADVTLDAYGTSKAFPAVVVSVDASPTTTNGVAAYKVILQFDQQDERIWAGMSANVTIIK